MVHAKWGVKIAHFLMKDLYQQTEYYTTQILQGQSIEEANILRNVKHSMLEKTSLKLQPILSKVLSKMTYEQQSPNGEAKQLLMPDITKEEADMKNLLGYLNQGEWLYSLNIGNIMQIAPLTMQDFMSSTSLELEVSREFVLEKLCFLCVSYFCIGTEYRFLHQLQEMLGENIYSRRDSEYWHGKAVEIAATFLPSESPLVSHIMMSYEKHHSPSAQSIPETEQTESHVKIIRQIKGVDSNKLQPMVRSHPDKDFFVPYSDIPPMDYKKIYIVQKADKLMPRPGSRDPNYRKRRPVENADQNTANSNVS